jgi:hypothetical protein
MSMMKMLLKNKGGYATAKSSHMENEDDFTKSISRQLSFDLFFPHSKIVEIKSFAYFVSYFDRCGLPPSYLS